MNELEKRVTKAISEAIGADGAAPDKIARAIIPIVMEEAAKIPQLIRAEIGADQRQQVALAYVEAAIRKEAAESMK